MYLSESLFARAEHIVLLFDFLCLAELFDRQMTIGRLLISSSVRMPHTSTSEARVGHASIILSQLVVQDAGGCGRNVSNAAVLMSRIIGEK